MKIEVGKYYKTRDGRKVGPVTKRGGYLECGGWLYRDNGECCFKGEAGRQTNNYLDLISEWPDTEHVSADVILTKAADHMKDRASTYDKPEGERSMSKTVEIFNLHHGTSLTEAQGWHFMQILKDVRLFSRDQYHADSAEDCVAYAALKAEALNAR